LLEQITELQANSDRLVAELNAQKSDCDRGQFARARLQEEVDELHALMDAKIGEETRRTEVEKGKEQELADLRSQVARLQADLSEARKLGLESQSKPSDLFIAFLNTQEILLANHLKDGLQVSNKIPQYTNCLVSFTLLLKQGKLLE
jgi:hypothetical protein